MRSRWHRAALVVAMVITGAGLPAIVAPSAVAAPGCTGSVAANATYACGPLADGYIRITVPARVNSVVVVADGGGGGKNDIQSPGGSGARVSASVTVTPGEVITVYVGSGGGAAVGGVGNVGGSGYGAGGNGGPYWGEGFGGGYGGGGGGSSAVLFGGDDTIIAGGGGGGGGFFAGGSASAAAGGSGGGDGSCSIGGGGGNANGLGGAGSRSGTGMTTAATSGFAGSGGDGTYGAGGSTSGGGGGGGGYGGGGPGNWTGPHACLIAGGGGAGGSYGPAGASFGLANNGGVPGTSGEGGDGSVSLSFIASPATAPDPPTNLIVSGVDDTSMDLSWTAPASDGGAAILGYDVVVNSAAPVRVVTASYSLSSLTPGQTYALAITAVNTAGPSTALTGSQQTTNPGVPTGPAMGLTFPDRTSSTITADWTPPAPVAGWPTLGYQVRVNGGPLTFTADDSYVARDLEPATTYSFEILVVNGAGTSTALTGDETTYSTTPGPPTGLVFSAVDDTSITASWTAPASNGGSAVTGYWVSVDGGASTWSPTTTFTKTGLTPATWHTFAVQAMNGVGASLELVGSQPTEATPSSPRMTATSVNVGVPSTVALVDFPAGSTQTVMVMAPDASVSNVTVTVNGSGSGTGTYTPASTGTYNLVSDPNATSTTFTASAAPGPGPGPGPGPAPVPTPVVVPVSQALDGIVGIPVTSTTAFTASNFLQPPTFAIAPALPAGLSIDPLTGVVSGTPTAVHVRTEHVITASAGSQSATATLQVAVLDAPPPPPVASILISGRAGMGKRAPRIYVEGSTTGLVGSMVMAHVRLPGQRMYAEAGTRTVRADGSFTWSMRTSRRAYVFFTGDDGVRSNRVIIRRD